MKIAIAGYGREGMASYRYFSRLGHDLTIVDERDTVEGLPAGTKAILGTGAFGKLQGFDMVIRTAGLAPRKITTDGKMWSVTNEFFAQCPAPIIGVTGSKGKGTTASLIASILQAAGKTTHLVGNIGLPALDELPSITADDIVVYELSSFQLWDIEKSPRVAVVLMIEPDHLDVHKSMEEYVAAKGNIVRFQAEQDRVIFNNNNAYAQSIAHLAKGEKVGYQTLEAAHVQDGFFWYGGQKLCPVESLKLPGIHNQDNACAAIGAAWGWVQDGEAIGRGLSAFTGLPHRLKFITDVNGVSYYDDSIATTPGSAIAAVRAFEQPKVLILGGSYKGADFTELAEVLSRAAIRSIILIGDEAPRIAAALDREEIVHEQLGVEVTMDQVVHRAAEVAQPGDAVILSPACASFGMFKNYADRGDKFIAAARQLTL